VDVPAHLELTGDQASAVAGDRGPGVQRAMRIVVGLARASGAERLIPISRAHVDGVLYHGQASQDFADWFTAVDARVAVPTTLNVAALDLLHPWLFRGDEVEAGTGRRLVDAYLALGCLPTMTCAPYQDRDRPGPGEDVAWAESNAIVFVNSVLGARTARYGDFSDIAAAVAGWVPDAGLHRPEARLAGLVVELDPDTEDWLTEESGVGALGVLVGRLAAGRVAAIVGLPLDTTEDALKALGAGAASSGSVAMFHAVGLTPEAPTLEAAVAPDREPARVRVDAAAIRSALAGLATVPDGPIDAVALGTPHFSVGEFGRLRTFLADDPGPLRVELTVNTSRSVLSDITESGWLDGLAAAGVVVVTDTCTYLSPALMRNPTGITMTNSAKWAYYAPGNLDARVVYGTMRDCVASARAGRVIRART
jgi:predicted aconitase